MRSFQEKRDEAFRVVQRQDESVDLTVIRAFLTALPMIGDDALRALAGYIHAKAYAEILERKLRYAAKEPE